MLSRSDPPAKLTRCTENADGPKIGIVVKKSQFLFTGTATCEIYTLSASK